MSANAKLTNQNYNLFDYGGMINAKNAVRTEAFTTALENCITPETVVLDIGTGTGYFALVAAKLGARHVYAIEPNPAIQIRARNPGAGMAAPFFNENSRRV